jgi:hypothetical protein
MIPQPLRDLVRDAWDVVVDVAGPARRTAKVTWREAMRILRRSLLPGLLERIVGSLLFAVLIIFVLMILRLVGLLNEAGK